MQQTTIKQTDTQQIKSHYEPTAISKIIFASRWLQLPIYLGLIIVQGIYAYKFMKSLWELIVNLNEMDSNTIMLAVLNLIDVVMIANLLVMKSLSPNSAHADTRISRNG